MYQKWGLQIYIFLKPREFKKGVAYETLMIYCKGIVKVYIKRCGCIIIYKKLM